MQPTVTPETMPLPPVGATVGLDTQRDVPSKDSSPLRLIIIAALHVCSVDIRKDSSGVLTSCPGKDTVRNHIKYHFIVVFISGSDIL
jgi:hypothetical protein